MIQVRVTGVNVGLICTVSEQNRKDFNVFLPIYEQYGLGGSTHLKVLRIRSLFSGSSAGNVPREPSTRLDL